MATCWIDTFNTATPGTWSYFDSIEDAYKAAIDYSSLNHNYQPLPTLKEVTGWLRNGAKMANICHYSAYRIWIYLGHSEPPYKHNSVYCEHMGRNSESKLSTITIVQQSKVSANNT